MFKKTISVFLFIIVLFSFSSCSSELRSYETPLALDSKSDLLSYTNNKYSYTIGYPDIFTESENAPNGTTLSADGVLFIVWAKKNEDNLTLQESYEKALSQYANATDGGIGRITYEFHFSNNDKESGYYYAVLHNDNIYSFVITYPKDKSEEFEEYINQMIKSFLIKD